MAPKDRNHNYEMIGYLSLSVQQRGSSLHHMEAECNVKPTNIAMVENPIQEAELGRRDQGVNPLVVVLMSCS